MRLRIFLLTFLFTACSSDDKPENMIPKDKMAKILSEIHILEAKINNIHFQHEDSAVFVYQKKKFELMKTLNVDTATFKVNLKYYMLNPNKMKEIYVIVKKLLEAKKKVIEDKRKLEDKQKKLIEDRKALADKKRGISPKKMKIDSVKKPLIKINKFKLPKKAAPNLL